MGRSPRSPTSCRSSAQGCTEAQVALRLTQFLDEWHYSMVSSSMSKHWDRTGAVRLAIDLLECNGAVFPDDHFKEELIRLEEDRMVAKLVEAMPIDMWETLDEVFGELMQALDVSTRLRGALDGAPDAKPVHQVIDETGDTSTTKFLMRSSIRVASDKYLKTKKCNSSWSQATEDRIDRLMRSAEDSDAAMRQLVVVESQLEDLGSTQKARSKGFLADFAASRTEGLKHLSFSSWLGVVHRAKNDGGVRAKFQERLDSAEKQLFEYKKTYVANVRNVLQRQLAGDDTVTMQTCIAGWSKAVEDQKREVEEAKKVQEARSKLDVMQIDQAASARKVFMAMASEKPEVILSTAIHGWTAYVELSKKEKEYDEAVRKGEELLKERMDAQKAETMKIVQKMICASADNIIKTAFGGWIEVIKEDVANREMGGKIDALNASYKSATQRQCGNAHGVQGRVNELMAATHLQSIFCNWYLVFKSESVENHFNRKLESKRRQLTGVQNLFRTFAKQLEMGLGDGDMSSRQNSDREFKRKVGKGDAKGGMVRGGDGSVSLPDIHQGHRHAWA